MLAQRLQVQEADLRLVVNVVAAAGACNILNAEVFTAVLSLVRNPSVLALKLDELILSKANRENMRLNV